MRCPFLSYTLVGNGKFCFFVEYVNLLQHPEQNRTLSPVLAVVRGSTRAVMLKPSTSKYRNTSAPSSSYTWMVASTMVSGICSDESFIIMNILRTDTHNNSLSSVTAIDQLLSFCCRQFNCMKVLLPEGLPLYP